VDFITLISLLVFGASVAAFVHVVRRSLRTATEAAGARGAGPGLDLGALARFTRSAHDEVGLYLHASYHGDPATLPAVLSSLIDHLQARARTYELNLDRDTVKRLVRTLAEQHRIARAQDIRDALDVLP
jgi:hypothetical protein